MHPAVLVGAAAVALLAGGKKKKSSSNGGSGSKTLKLKAIKIPTGPSQPPSTWGKCPNPPGSGKNVHSAYTAKGECMVFWDNSTWEVLESYVADAVSNMSEADRADICNAPECIPDDFAIDPDLFCEWKEAPALIDLTRVIVLQMYPQLSNVQFPPKSPTDLPYFPSLVWRFVMFGILKYHCGYEPVT